MIQFKKATHLLAAGALCSALALPAMAQIAPPKPVAPKPVAPPARKDEFRRLVDNFGDTDKKIYKSMSREEKGLLKRVAHMGKQVTNTVK